MTNLRWGTLVSGCICALVISAKAEALTVTVGSPLTLVANGTALCGGPCTWANTALREAGASVTSPISGVIVRWRIAPGSSGGPFTLRVLHPVGGGLYAASGTSSPGQPVGSGENTFPTGLPVQAGDLIGLNLTIGSGIPRSSIAPGSTESVWNPALADGSTGAPTGNFPGGELLFNADVQPQPEISSITPESGSIEGGTNVIVTGHDFSSGSVTFGNLPAKNFTVDSDGQIAAVSPPVSNPGPVDMRVTTPAGTTPLVLSDKFTYTACVVPKLKGKKLKTDRKKLGRADCKLGKIKGPKGRAVKVKKQKPTPGTILPPGSSVKVTTR
jgi:IPT/TIG domain-containing protein/PASTA domain-containing protein